MSTIQTNLCSVLLTNFYGEIVSSVGTFLLKQMSPCTLKKVVKGVRLPISTVKKALCILIQHGFGDFVEGDKGSVEYLVKHENVLYLLYYDHYLYWGDMCESPAILIVDEILNAGRLTMISTLQKVSERLKGTDTDVSIYSIQEKFTQLVQKHYLMRCKYPHASENFLMPKMSISPEELYIVPQINLGLLESSAFEENGESGENQRKKQKVEFPDSGIYWKINHDQFLECFRNELITQVCGNRLDQKAAEIVKTILTLSETKSNLSITTIPVPLYEISNSLRRTTKITSQELESYIAVLCEGMHSFVSKADDSSGGMYVVNIKKVMQKCVENLASTVVLDRFGSKCARIFRILLDKKKMESKQIEEVAMLHPRDTKEYIYRMFEENFIKSHDIPKGSDYSHGQIYYLLYIDITQVSYMLLEHCYLSLFNIITSMEIQNSENKRLLEKKQRVEAIVRTLEQLGNKEDEIQDVQNSITPHEETVIKKVSSVCQKIDAATSQLAEMVLMFDIWFHLPKC